MFRGLGFRGLEFIEFIGFYLNPKPPTLLVLLVTASLYITYVLKEVGSLGSR